MEREEQLNGTSWEIIIIKPLKGEGLNCCCLIKIRRRIMIYLNTNINLLIYFKHYILIKELLRININIAIFSIMTYVKWCLTLS